MHSLRAFVKGLLQGHPTMAFLSAFPKVTLQEHSTRAFTIPHGNSARAFSKSIRPGRSSRSLARAYPRAFSKCIFQAHSSRLISKGVLQEPSPRVFSMVLPLENSTRHSPGRSLSHSQQRFPWLILQELSPKTISKIIPQAHFPKAFCKNILKELSQEHSARQSPWAFFK